MNIFICLQDISSDNDSDDEPCMKQPRLSSDYSAYVSYILQLDIMFVSVAVKICFIYF